MGGGGGVVGGGWWRVVGGVEEAVFTSLGKQALILRFNSNL